MKKTFWAHKTAEISPKAKIGENTKIWHYCQILKNAQIGKDCVVGHNCFIGSGAKIGNNVKLESNIDVWDLVTLENYVFVGPSAVFTNDINPRAKYPKKKYSQYGKWLPILVKEGASIGANATIVCSTVIGNYAFVGAGAVVKEDIPDYAVAVGVPARIIGWMCECGQKLNFEKNKAICKICKKRYYKLKNEVYRS